MREINGRTRVCGLMGYPVEHTLSPLIHNTLAQELGVDMAYVPFSVEPGRLKEAVEGARALNLAGLNVTVPHKREVISYLEQIDPLAQKVGAVNTLVRCGDGFKGYNTDLTGLQRAMKEDGIELVGERVILLGAGGAARAVAFLCAYAGASEVWMLNRTLKKAQAVAAEVNQAFGRECIHGLALSDHEKIPKGSYLAVQGTSVGLFPHVEDVVTEDAGFYQKIHTGYDLIYRPSATKFMQLVRAHGGKAYNGLKMLAYQGIQAFELWNGVAVERAQAASVMKKLKEETGAHE